MKREIKISIGAGKKFPLGDTNWTIDDLRWEILRYPTADRARVYVARRCYMFYRFSNRFGIHVFNPRTRKNEAVATNLDALDAQCFLMKLQKEGRL